jgi:hypothetical protein
MMEVENKEPEVENDLIEMACEIAQDNKPVMG